MSLETRPTDILNSVKTGALEQICKKFGVRWLAVFGSVAKGAATNESDVDVLVEYESGRPVTYLDVVALSQELSPIFGGRSIDLGRPKQLHWFIRDRVLREARVLYER